MDLTFLQYTSGSYRTTNPPISESRELTVWNEAPGFGSPRYVFRVKDTYNADERQTEYPLTPAQYEEIVSLFERLALAELFFARMHETPLAPAPFAQTGGMTRSLLSFTANGVTMTASQLPPEASELTQHLLALRAAFVATEPPLHESPGQFLPGQGRPGFAAKPF